jgi:glycosyltransferase involved in cell wall biosynthesis
MAKERLRVVMIVENNSYPEDVRVRREAETLANTGHRVTVIAPRKTRKSWRETINGVHVVRFPLPITGGGVISYVVEFGLGTFIPAFLVLVEWIRFGLDVVHVHNPPDSLFIAGILPKLLGKRLVYDHHDLAPELYLAKAQVTGGPLYRLLLLFERFSCNFADYIITVNDSYRRSDVTRNHVREDRTVVVRNGPPLSHTAPIEGDDLLHQRGEVVIAYLGNISHQDGVDHLIEALRHLRHELGYTDWYAAIIGPMDDHAFLAKLVKDYSLEDDVWFAGYQPEPRWRALIAGSDIGVVPDPANPVAEKSTMIKMMDYMAHGKPVVAYDLVENRVSGGDAALYAQASDPSDLARQLARLIDSPALRAQLGELGRSRIRESLAWEYSERELLRLYNELIAAP